MKMLQGRFRWTKSRGEYEKAADPLAKEIAKAPGLVWKVWAFDDEKSMATGVYLFKDLDTLNNYLKWLHDMGPTPGVEDFKVTVWDVQSGLSKITKGPI